MLGAILGGAAGGGMSSSSSAPSGATGGTQDTAMGDFNFKTASGAASIGDGLSVPVVVALAALVGLALWTARRK